VGGGVKVHVHHTAIRGFLIEVYLTDWLQGTDVLRGVQLIGGLTEWGELMSVSLGILIPLDEEASALFLHAGSSTQKNHMST
jgi:hypothetical protein